MFKKILTNSALKKYYKILEKVEKKSDAYQLMSDNQLKDQTKKLKQRLVNGETLDDILPDAFATVREADRRVLGMFPFAEQILGGIILHSGNVAEMKTGEGKTLTATMPLYLNALSGRGVMLITVNEYLAARDAKEIGPVFEWLGLKVATGVPEENQSEDDLDKKEIYSSDIIYTTNSGLGFDYLFENLAENEDDKNIREFNYAVIDEIDAVLLDMAQTPLIISGAPRVQSNLYQVTNYFIETLKINEDYELDEEKKHVWLTENGITHAESFFGIDNIMLKESEELYRYVMLALKAHFLYQRNKDYVVENGEIILLDITNGRKLTGTKLQAGIHQSIEAKENIEITIESRAMASITYQNLFRMFRKLSGMTGTGKTDAEELRDMYNMNVIVVPTHKPIQRIDKEDSIYFDLESKIIDSVEQIKYFHEKGQPVLLGSGSVTMSELYSRILLREGIPHSVLNARNVALESQIIKEAGRKGAVTVATAMAGRGTDIKISKEVDDLGGLVVIGTERMESKRIDNQLRGRSGRQGNKGHSEFFVSLDDTVLLQYGPQWLKKYIDKNKNKKISKLTGRKFKKIIDRAQKSAESQNKSSRMQTLEFDEVSRIQREKVYEVRNFLLQDGNEYSQILIGMAEEWFSKIVSTSKFNRHTLLNFIVNNLDYQFDRNAEAFRLIDYTDTKTIQNFLVDFFKKGLMQKKDQISSDFQFKYFQKLIILKAIDTQWVEEVDNLQQLKTIVTNRNLAQHNPVYEYQIEAKKSFDIMINKIYEQSVSGFMLSELALQEDGTVEVEFA
ncbi:accessory Sec system translocase SecA2 [Leuconostoc palmae]|uniref:accessory Sec system translocase SecA2 n=1 Tax=Leuconostoc palmae TaxID=501487 RepID=UPI001C7D158B|nr:accessory Sec system translocase SecA2 [Leuconostoc palmae]